MGTGLSSEFQLLTTDEKMGAMEEKLFAQRLRDIRKWWETPRFDGIKRPYSAEDVVSKSGSLEQTYPSSLMAQKLFKLLQERSAAGEPVHTSAFFFEQGMGNMW
jgi:isocitrate lyase